MDDYSDDEKIENDTIANNSLQHLSSTENTVHNKDHHNDDSDDDKPFASGEMILANPPHLQANTPLSTISYTGEKVFSLLTWIGSSIYSLTNLFSSNITQEEQHMNVLNTIAKLNNHLVFLDKKIDSMNRNSQRFSEKAKMLYKTKKMTSAIHQIRLKKMYDCEIGKLEKLKFNIETNILHMDSVEIMMVTVDTIKDTSDHFQKINTTLNIEKLEDTIDELVEHRDASTDIQSVLNDMQLFNDASYDEADLIKELELMSNDNSENPINPSNNKTNVPSTIVPSDLPEAPTTTLPDYNNTESNTNNQLALSAVF